MATTASTCKTNIISENKDQLGIGSHERCYCIISLVPLVRTTDFMAGNKIKLKYQFNTLQPVAADKLQNNARHLYHFFLPIACPH